MQQHLALPVADDALDRLAGLAAPQHTTYEARSFVGAVPEALAQGWAEVNASLYTEAPQGDLERDPGVADVAAVRAGEALLVAQGRTRYATVALRADGAVAAYTTLIHHAARAGPLLPVGHPGATRGSWPPAGRGREGRQPAGDAGRPARDRPGHHLERESNTHMIGVNEALGSRPVERMGSFQKRVAPAR